MNNEINVCDLCYMKPYQLFPEQIGAQVYNLTPEWPLMTDGPATQSVFIDNVGEMAIYIGNVGTLKPTKLAYTGNNGSSAEYSVGTADGNSNNEIVIPSKIVATFS